MWQGHQLNLRESTRVSAQVVLIIAMFSTLSRSTVSTGRRLLSTGDVKLIPTKGPLGKYVYSDPFLFNQGLSEDEKMIQSSARDFCQTELMPNIIQANRHETFDPKIMKVRGGGA